MTAIFRGTSRDEGRNATVTLYPDRIERVKQRSRTSVRRAHQDVEITPTRSVTSVQTTKAGMRTNVTVYASGNNIEFRFDHGEAARFRDALTALITGATTQPAPHAAQRPPPRTDPPPRSSTPTASRNPPTAAARSPSPDSTASPTAPSSARDHRPHSGNPCTPAGPHPRPPCRHHTRRARPGPRTIPRMARERTGRTGGPMAHTGWTPSRTLTGRARQAARRRIWRRDNGTCRYCGHPADPTTWALDHIVSIRNGGIDHDHNLCVACEQCHTTKTRAEQQAGRRRTRRPAEPHPGARTP